MCVYATPPRQATPPCGICTIQEYVCICHSSSAGHPTMRHMYHTGVCVYMPLLLGRPPHHVAYVPYRCMCVYATPPRQATPPCGICTIQVYVCICHSSSAGHPTMWHMYHTGVCVYMP